MHQNLSKYNTWNYLTVCKQINLPSLVNLFYIMHIYLNVCKQMTDVKLLLLHSNTQNHYTVCKQMINITHTIYF